MNSTRSERIEKLLLESLQPQYLVLENESHMHAVPDHSETHFKVLVVSSVFEGKTRIDRQRLINELLKHELQSGLHALTQKLLTPVEWEAQQLSLNFESPQCLGGSKAKSK